MELISGGAVVNLFKRLALVSVIGGVLVVVSGCQDVGSWPDASDRFEGRAPVVQEEDKRSEGMTAYDDGLAMQVGKEDFVERFNERAVGLEIVEVEEMNKSNNLVFQLASIEEEVESGYYLTARNNPVDDKLMEVTLSQHEEEGTFNGDVFEGLVMGVYDALNENGEERDLFAGEIEFIRDVPGEEEEINKVFALMNYDVFVERSEEGAVVAFHTRGTLGIDGVLNDVREE